MKFFESFKYESGIFGFGLYQSTTQKYLFYSINALTLFIACISLSLSFIYFFHDANTFQEYTLSVYVSASIMLVLACYGIFMRINWPILKLIIVAEKIADESELEFKFIKFVIIDGRKLSISGQKYPESKAIYNEFISQAEKWREFLNYAIMRIPLNCVMCPKLILCSYRYYTTDLGNDALELPFPIW